MTGGGGSPPAPAPTPLMPSMDTAAIARANKRAAAATQERSGRLSTVLSQTATTDKLGG